MRERLSVSSIAVLIVSCLLIAYSKRATDITAVIGYAGLVFALVLIMIGLVYRDKQWNSAQKRNELYKTNSVGMARSALLKSFAKVTRILVSRMLATP